MKNNFQSHVGAEHLLCKLTLTLAFIPALLSAGEVADITAKNLTASGVERADFLQPFGSIRARYDFGDTNGFDKSTLGSIRTRVGLMTRSLSGFSLLVEGENTYILTDRDKYRPYPGYPPSNRTVIADPENIQLNRVQLSYESEAFQSKLTVGRQLIHYGDHRFIGNVGWRQNDQTYDAIRFENSSLDNLKFNYAYLAQVNRIFGAKAPSRGLQKWDSDSHLFELEYSGIENHKLKVFSYLLDFSNSAANSSNTYGMELTGSSESCIGDLQYIFTAAVQKDAANNPVDYQAYYLRGQVAVKRDAYHFGLGSEMMTSDGSGRFLFPLGTNHKFNGFADAFLTTPTNGLIDTYAWIGTETYGINHKLSLHNYQSEELSSSIGWELDYVASKQLCKSSKGILKLAHLMGDNGQADITRASIEINYSF